MLEKGHFQTCHILTEGCKKSEVAFHHHVLSLSHACKLPALMYSERESTVILPVQ